MAASLGSLVVSLGLDAAEYTTGLNKAEYNAKKMAREIDKGIVAAGKAFAASSVIIGVAVAGMVTKFIDAADTLNDLRTITGLTGNQLLVLQGAAVRSGVEMGAVGDVVGKLTKRLQAARTGTGDAADAFRAMGIDVEDGEGKLKSIDTILREVGVKFKGYEDGTDKIALAVAALGKGGDRLIPLVEAIEETDERFKRLGITIDEDTITAADKFKDTMEDVKSVNSVLAGQLAQYLLPHLQQVAEVMITVQKNSDLVKTAVDFLLFPFKALATGAIVLGASIANLGDVMAGYFLAQQKMRQLDFAGALEEITAAADRVEGRISGVSDVVRKLWEDAQPPALGAAPGDFVGPPVPKGVRTPAPRIVPKADLDAQQKLLDSMSKLRLESLKDAAARETQLLEAQHQQALISDAAYWSRKAELQRSALDAELKVLDEQIVRQQTLADKEKKGTKDYYEAQATLQESLAKRNKLEQDGALAVQLLGMQQQAAAKAYAREVEDLNIQLLELQGNTAEASRRRFALSTADQRQRFTANNDQAALAQLDAIEKLTAAKARFNQESEKQSLINSQLALEEERIQNSLRTGAISEIEALNKTSAARRAAIVELEQTVVSLERVAATSKDPALILQADQARVALEKLRSESDLLAQKFNTLFTEAGADELANFVDKTKTASEAFKSFSDTVLRELNRMAAQEVMKMIFGGGTGGGIGGILSGIFGGGASSQLQGPTQSGGNLSSSVGLFAQIAGLFGGGFAVGTPFVPRDQLAFVHRGERIVPANENNAGGMGMNVTNVFHISGATDRRSQLQIAAAAGEGVQRAMIRNS